MTIQIEPFVFDDFLDRVRQRVPFTFSRWGDGEWRSVLGKTGGVNCDAHPFYPQMGKDLAAVLKSRPTYTLGMQAFAMRLYGSKIEAWLQQQKLDDLHWVDSDVIHRGAIAGRLNELIDLARSIPLVLVGPSHLFRIERLKPLAFVGVPNQNCYTAVNRVVQDVTRVMSKQHEPTLISISASMPAEIIIDRLYPRLGTQHMLIDFGSVWDPAAGVKSRAYMRRKP